MTQTQVDKTMLWVLTGTCSCLLLMVAFFLSRFYTNNEKNFDYLNSRVDVMQQIQQEMKEGQVEMKGDIRYIKFDTVRMQDDIEDLKKKLTIR